MDPNHAFSLNILMLFSPLEQFAIIRILTIRFGGLDISITNSLLMTLLGLSLLLIGYFSTMKESGGKVVPTYTQLCVESQYTFIKGLVGDQLGKDGYPYLPVIFAVFTLILGCNLVGMVPYSFTPTSHFIFTLGLSLSLFIGLVIIGFGRHGLHFFSLLLPAGTPLGLAPFLVLLELISYVFKVISLGVRLAANMLAGHCLLKILAGFVWTMLLSGSPLLMAAGSVPFGAIVILTGVEFGIAAIQAYVFTMLFCIYLQEALNLH